MAAPLDGRLGVSIQSGRRTVSRLGHEGAFLAGWRIGDTIVEVNGRPVEDNDAVKAAVKGALEAHQAHGAPLRFVVRRVPRPAVDTSSGMLRMTPGTGGGLTVRMADLLRDLIGDFPVVLFLDGTLRVPNGNLSALAAQLLQEAGVGFKAVDCSDEKYNPGVRDALEELAGEYALPQLFAGGARLGNGHDVEALHRAGRLADRLLLAQQMSPVTDAKAAPSVPGCS